MCAGTTVGHTQCTRTHTRTLLKWVRVERARVVLVQRVIGDADSNATISPKYVQLIHTSICIWFDVELGSVEVGYFPGIAADRRCRLCHYHCLCELYETCCMWCVSSMWEIYKTVIPISDRWFCCCEQLLHYLRSIFLLQQFCSLDLAQNDTF